MPEQTIAESQTRRSSGPTQSGPRGRARPSTRAAVWLAVGGGVVLVALAWVVVTRMRPTYDAFGWLVWGRQVLHWDLNTDGAPSWKPLTFLFTLPYGLARGNARCGCG